MPPEYVGGIGDKGAAALKEFAEQGGTLILLQSRIGLRHPGSGRQSEERSEWRPESRFLFPRLAAQRFSRPEEPARLRHALADHALERTKPDLGSPRRRHRRALSLAAVLASGWLLGEKYLTGKAALLDVPMGSGRMILFGMRPQYRGQSYQNFKLFFNALVYPK